MSRASTLGLVLVSDRDKPAFDSLVERAQGGTIFHRLDFLAYHGQRFADNQHHLLFLKGDLPWAAMPLGLFRQEGGLVALSPYGASYGGPVFASPPRYHECLEALELLLDHLGQQGVVELRLTMPPAFCYQNYCETFRFALLERGFLSSNRDITSVVPLRPGRPQAAADSLSQRVRRMAKKAGQAGVTVQTRAPLADFWRPMEETFTRHGASPTHSPEQYGQLCRLFPEHIFADVAYLEGQPVAGVGHLAPTALADCSFYLCQSHQGREHQALSLLLLRALEEASSQGRRWFDLGTSSVGMQSRPNIFEFKEGFGARGMFRESFTWRRESGGR